MPTRIAGLFARVASRRAARVLTEVRFCDSCSRVSTLSTLAKAEQHRSGIWSTARG